MTDEAVEGEHVVGVGGSRTPWDQLPEEVRRWVESRCGAPVVAASIEPGGFSPGVASRLQLTDGKTMFFKAVSALVNPDSPALHRQEALITASLPAGVPAPHLVDSYDDGTWVGLLFDAIEGRSPRIPWEASELQDVLATLADYHQQVTPNPVAAAPGCADMLGDSLAGWRTLAGAPSPDPRLDDWSLEHLDQLAELEAPIRDAVAGDTLLHCDLRHDNILVTSVGVVFVDWPWACQGASVFDVIAFAPSVSLQGGPDPATTLAMYPAEHGTDDAAITVAVAALAGLFTASSLRPSPPGLPSLRRFQAAQAGAARRWLAERVRWP